MHSQNHTNYLRHLNNSQCKCTEIYDQIDANKPHRIEGKYKTISLSPMIVRVIYWKVPEKRVGSLWCHGKSQ